MRDSGQQMRGQSPLNFGFSGAVFYSLDPTVGASWICYFRALKLGPATLVALFGAVFLGERPSLNGWIGIALIAAGAVLIVVKN
jgi:uncharacterized membrane protein